MAAEIPRSNPVRFFLGGYVKNVVYKNQYENVHELQAELRRIILNIHHTIIKKSTGSEIMKRARLCIEQDGKHFEHLIN